MKMNIKDMTAEEKERSNALACFLQEEDEERYERAKEAMKDKLEANYANNFLVDFGGSVFTALQEALGGFSFEALMFRGKKKTIRALDRLGLLLTYYSEASYYSINKSKELILESLAKASHRFPKSRTPIVYTTMLMPRADNFTTDVWAEIANTESFRTEDYGRLNFTEAVSELIREGKIANICGFRFLKGHMPEKSLVFEMQFQLCEKEVVNKTLQKEKKTNKEGINSYGPFDYDLDEFTVWLKTKEDKKWLLKKKTSVGFKRAGENLFKLLSNIGKPILEVDDKKNLVTTLVSNLEISKKLVEDLFFARDGLYGFKE